MIRNKFLISGLLGLMILGIGKKADAETVTTATLIEDSVVYTTEDMKDAERGLPKGTIVNVLSQTDEAVEVQIADVQGYVPAELLIIEETEIEEPEQSEEESESKSSNHRVSDWIGSKLTKYKGVNYGPSGKETYYNLNMSGVVRIMRRLGLGSDEYPYWVREDGVKMLGDYVMVAANLKVHPRGTLVDTSLGKGIVCDTGDFASWNPTQLDIATAWV